MTVAAHSAELCAFHILETLAVEQQALCTSGTPAVEQQALHTSGTPAVELQVLHILEGVVQEP